MNLFIIAWNQPTKRQPMAVDQLKQMIDVYPQIDLETLWHRSSSCGTLFSASMHTADKIAAPRQYVMQDENEILFFSGLPVNPKGSFPAHRAEALSEHWQELTENIEGLYSITRIILKPLQFVIQTDILGFEQVYYYRHADCWLISNSVQLIERISEPQPFDPLGVSTFLSLGWAGGDHTLRSGIKVMPAGQRWTWREKETEPKKQKYYPASKLAHQPRQKLNSLNFKKLSEDLIQPLYRLSENFDNITCPITGGKDSRLLATLLNHANLSCRYYTIGELSGLDAEIAKRVAQTADLNYEIKHTSKSAVIDNWENGCWQVVRQADGMFPLQLIAGVITFQLQHVDHLNIRLWGAGGEIARGFYADSTLYFGGNDLVSVTNFLVRKRLRNYRGLIRKDGIALARDYINQFAKQCVEDGFSVLDIPDLLYTYQRVGRRAGSNWRASMSIRDSFSPLCTRPFIETTFSLPSLQRFTEPLHYGLIQFLAKELHEIPFDKDPWTTQQPVINLLKSYSRLQLKNYIRRFSKLFGFKPEKKTPPHIVKDSMFDRSSWFEAKREEVREVCLSANNSILWNFIDREKFDKITSSAVDQNSRVAYLKALYHIATLFYYDADEWRRNATSNNKIESNP